MKKKTLVGAALVALAILVLFLVVGLKRVPQGSEALLVSDGGRLVLYESGWHLIRPMSGNLVTYPVGELNLRYPQEGSQRVLLKNGREADVAFSFRLNVPQGSAEDLYKFFGEKFAAGLDKIFLDAIEIQAVKFIPEPAEGMPNPYASAVAEELKRTFRDVRLTLLSVKIESWALTTGEGAAGAANIAPTPLRKIVFIGVDAGDWLIINPLIAKGKLPNFKKIVEGGAAGPLQSINPMISPLLWTTMATGKLPEEHGILTCTVIDPNTNTQIPVTRMYRKVDAIWNMMSDYGRTVDMVGYLATYPAEKINGTMVTDRVGYIAFAATPVQGDAPIPGAISPPERYEEIASLLTKAKDVPFRDIKRFIHVDESEFNKNRGSEFDTRNIINNTILTYVTALNFNRIAVHLLEKDHPDFLAVYFELVDAMGHLFMPYAPPQESGVSDEKYRKFKDAITETYVFQDQIIGELLDKCDKNTVLLITSDHGFKSGDSRLKAGAEIPGGHAAEWHRPEGIVCLYGNGIRKGYRIEGASIVDIAPTILALAGFPRVGDMPGKIIEQAFEPSLKKSLNTTAIATLQRTRAREVAAVTSGGATDEAAMKKLEALGYITRENPDALNNLGQRYQNQGEYEKAIVEFKKALALRPNYSRVLNNLGVCYGKLNRNQEAVDSFLKAIQADPRDVFAMNNIAITYSKAGRFNEARQYAQRAVEIEPKYARGHFTLGLIYRTTGEFKLAEREFQTALKIEPGNQEFRRALEKSREMAKGQR
ncbi:MAG: alkaline phosphatase family protein [Candidatus Eisenbacteria bacterium]|nr:alkaline phosphatase family protein [Candidatus Eisenbacteria bacterium]